MDYLVSQKDLKVNMTHLVQHIAQPQFLQLYVLLLQINFQKNQKMLLLLLAMERSVLEWLMRL